MTKLLNAFLWLSYIEICLFIPMCSSDTSVLSSDHTDMYDVFPLSSDLHYKYLYNYIHSKPYHGGQQYKWTDSGTVEYSIKDSINLSSTLRLWILSENISLLHQQYSSPDQIVEMKQDSSYWVNYVATDSLYEELSYTHMISCNSLIWNFPFSNKLWSSSLPVSRYSSSTNPVIVDQSAQDNGFYGFHSNNLLFVFAKDTGLTSASYVYSYGSQSAVSYGYQTTEIKLLSFSKGLH